MVKVHQYRDPENKEYPAALHNGSSRHGKWSNSQDIPTGRS